MKQSYNTLKKLIPIFLISFLTLKANEVKAWEFNKKLCEEFAETSELYLINSPITTHKLTTGNGRAFTFEQIVQESWPNKKVITINEKDFNKLKDASKKFHIIILSTKMTSVNNGSYRDLGTVDGVVLQQGKIGHNINKNYIYWLQIPLNEILKGVATERLIYTVENLKKIASHANKNNWDKNQFKSLGYKEVLKSDTLYVKKTALHQEITNPVIFQKAYSYPYKVVTDEQWLRAISEKRANVLFSDMIGEGYYKTVNIYKAKDGDLVISSYPWPSQNKITEYMLMSISK